MTTEELISRAPDALQLMEKVANPDGRYHPYYWPNGRLPSAFNQQVLTMFSQEMIEGGAVYVEPPAFPTTDSKTVVGSDHLPDDFLRAFVRRTAQEWPEEPVPSASARELFRIMRYAPGTVARGLWIGGGSKMTAAPAQATDNKALAAELRALADRVEAGQ